MVRIGDADIRGGIGGNIGDNVIIDSAVVRIQAQVYRNIGIKRLKVLNGFFVNIRLGLELKIPYSLRVYFLAYTNFLPSQK